MHFGNIVVRLHAPDDWDETKVIAAVEALDDLDLPTAVKRLVLTHVETRKALDGLRVVVSESLE